MRVLEETLELAQAEGIAMEDVDKIQRQVYDKPTGNSVKELGGLLIVTTGYANAADLDMNDVFNQELARIHDPDIIDRIRFRNFHGDKLGLRDDS